MNHRVSNGRVWLTSGWRAWVVAFAAVLIATGTIFTAFMKVYKFTPFYFSDRLDAEAAERVKLEAKVDQQAKTDAKIIHYLSLSSVIMTEPNAKDSQEVRDAKRRMRRMFVIDPTADEQERGR